MAKPTEGSGGAAIPASFRYDAEIDVNSDSTHAKVVRLVGTGERVLELGCATGYMSRVFRDRGCQVVAVEIDPKAAARASAFCERVIVGDIEQMDLAQELGEDRFDVVVAADVLEHLKDPLSVLLTVKRYLRDDGYIVASIPNVAHGSVRLALLSGQFLYRELGLLDRTHLRFYTRDTMEKLLYDGGFVIAHLGRQERQIDDSEVLYDKTLIPAGLLDTLSRDPEALTYQFIVVAYPMPHAALELVGRRIRELTEEKEAAWRDVAELRQSVSKQTDLERRIRELAEEGEAAQREVAELRGAIEKLIGVVEELAAAVEALVKGDRESVGQFEYQQIVKRIRAVVRESLPADARILVVSKGDPELVRLEGRQAWHFPQDREGHYSGFNPADSGSAVVQLEAMRSKGAQYLLLPSTAFWWTDHYRGFKRRLDRRYRVVIRREDACVIYSLGDPPVEASASTELEAAINEYRDRFGRDPAILDWSTGLRLAEALPDYLVFSPPAAARSELAYLDHTVDIVVVASRDPTVAAEARRVASGAVVNFSDPDRDVRGGIPQVEWLREADALPLATASIIIPSYNGIALTEACLAALAETLPADFRGEIIVVDDCSTDDTEPRLARWAEKEPRLKVLRNPENCGFVVTCNTGAAAARGEIIVLLNNDTLPQEGWLEPLLRIFRDKPDAGAVGGRLVYPDGRMQEAGGIVFADGSAANFGKWDCEIDAPLYNYVREVDYVTGALIATPRSLFNELGRLDTHYRPIYYEETDYCFKLRARGYRVYYQPESVVIHLEGVTCGTDVNSGQKRYQAVNRAKFVERWRGALKRQPRPPAKFDWATWYALAVREESEEADE
jgi:GT2 family glycosyltransferase/2-polyprenyl-3-methyl-5-hydroxy-6-metoxy-1,4-benzoquinol methylase